MVVRSMPASRSQKKKVPNTSASGKPAENPSENMRNEAGSKYTVMVSSHAGLSANGGVSGVGVVIKE
jgi:hypothetical protein